MKRKLFQFRVRNSWKDNGCGGQIAILPRLDVFFNFDEFDKVYVWCLAFGWLGWCFEFWINASEELV